MSRTLSVSGFASQPLENILAANRMEDQHVLSRPVVQIKQPQDVIVLQTLKERQLLLSGIGVSSDWCDILAFGVLSTALVQGTIAETVRTRKQQTSWIHHPLTFLRWQGVVIQAEYIYIAFFLTAIPSYKGSLIWHRMSQSLSLTSAQFDPWICRGQLLGHCWLRCLQCYRRLSSFDSVLAIWEAPPAQPQLLPQVEWG